MWQIVKQSLKINNLNNGEENEKERKSQCEDNRIGDWGFKNKIQQKSEFLNIGDPTHYANYKEFVNETFETAKFGEINEKSGLAQIILF